MSTFWRQQALVHVHSVHAGTAGLGRLLRVFRSVLLEEAVTQAPVCSMHSLCSEVELPTNLQAYCVSKIGEHASLSSPSQCSRARPSQLQTPCHSTDSDSLQVSGCCLH